MTTAAAAPHAPRLWLVLLGLALGLVTLRLVGLGLYPVMDTAEARYAEIARKMVELDAFLVPMYTYAEPFWGKPPLAFWASAISLDWFGINAFAARLPHWGFGVATMALVWRLTRHDRLWAALSVLVLAGANQGYEAMGAVKTDPVLMFAVTLSLAGFWLGHVERRRGWYAACFVGAGLTLLAKGPVGLVLIGLGGLAWLLWQRRLANFLRDWRWLPGLLIAAAIAVPWYALAERASPGFIGYFLVGEHFERFVVPGWAGDLYGAGHKRPPGMIWAYVLEAAMPWSVLLPIMMFWQRERWRLRLPSAGFDRFCLCWLAAPLVLFTFASNLLPTYVMPALPAASMLIARALLALAPLTPTARRGWVLAICCCAVIFPGVRFLPLLGDDSFARSRNQQPIVEAWHHAIEERPGDLYYVGRRRFSAEFYSRGQLTYLGRAGELGGRSGYLVIHEKFTIDAAPARCEKRLEQNEHSLWYCRALDLN